MDGSNYALYSHSGKVRQNIDVTEHIKQIQDHGAGEMMFNSIDKDGTGKGYDLNFYKSYKKIWISKNLNSRIKTIQVF